MQVYFDDVASYYTVDELDDTSTETEHMELFYANQFLATGLGLGVLGFSTRTYG
jgi:hypothetical protein